MKYHIFTIGCQMNKSDSERIAALLEAQGMMPAAARAQADLVVITTCGVRQSAEDRIYGLVPRIKKDNPDAKIVLTGCLAHREDVRKILHDQVDIFLDINDLVQLDISALGFSTREYAGLDDVSSSYLDIAPRYSSTFSAFVPIGNGCNNFCTYCVVPYARGRESYRPAADILSEVKKLAERGYKEITLIAQNVNSYRSAASGKYPGADAEYADFADLLRAADAIPGDFWIRFATSHPKDMSDKLIETLIRSKKVCRHLHLPAQAGNDEILRRMNRNYTLTGYLGLVEKIRKQWNDGRRMVEPEGQGQARNLDQRMPVSLTTDIIVGFPGESDEQFEDTVELFRKASFDMAYLAQYSPRPGTAAAKFKDDVSPEEKKRREKKLDLVLRQTAKMNNERYLGKMIRVLVDAVSQRAIVGRSETNKIVKIVSSEKISLGEFVNVEITSVQDFGLIGKV